LDDPVSNSSIPYTYFKQDGWDLQIHNKLHEIHSLVGKTPCSYGKNRKEEVVLTRCGIGHSRLTHSYLLNNEERPKCIPCNSNYSLKHVLIDMFGRHSTMPPVYLIYLQISQATQF
jgi:hypothetical protein